MISNASRDMNEKAFRSLKPHIDQAFPAGRFVAIDEGRIVGDAATFEDLHSKLDRLGKTSKDVLVVQAGVSYPEDVVILASEL
jgi:hypothetical protein